MLSWLREKFSHARSVCWMIPMLIVSTTVMGILSLISSFFDSMGVLQHKIASAWGRQLLALFLVDMRVIGTENLNPDQHYVFVSNHFSLIDTPVMFGSMPRPFRILARHGLWKIPFIGWHLNRAGHLPVNREDAREAVRNIAAAAEKIQSGYSILLFPQGGRTRGETMRPFKPGAAYIAIQAGVPIVPMALVGTRKILSPGSTHLRPGIAELRIGAPVSTEGLHRRDGKKLIQEIRETIGRMSEAPIEA